jgi:hypothetical protein
MASDANGHQNACDDDSIRSVKLPSLSIASSSTETACLAVAPEVNVKSPAKTRVETLRAIRVRNGNQHDLKRHVVRSSIRGLRRSLASSHNVVHVFLLEGLEKRNSLRSRRASVGEKPEITIGETIEGGNERRALFGLLSIND